MSVPAGVCLFTPGVLLHMLQVSNLKVCLSPKFFHNPLRDYGLEEGHDLPQVVLKGAILKSHTVAFPDVTCSSFVF
jgi:hypothetical protein